MLLKVANENIPLTPEGEKELRRASRGEGAFGGALIGSVLGSKIGNRIRRAGKYSPVIGLGLGAVTGGLLGRKLLGKALEQQKRMGIISAYAGDISRWTPAEARRAVSRYNLLGKRRAMRREGKTWDEIDRETLKVAPAYGFTPNENIPLTPEGEKELRRESRGKGTLGGIIIGSVLGSKIGDRIRRTGKIGKYSPVIGLGLGAVTGGLLGREHLGRALEQRKRMKLISTYVDSDYPREVREARRAVSRYNLLGQRRAMLREGKTWDEIDRETLKVASAYGFTPEELDYIIQEGLEELI